MRWFHPFSIHFSVRLVVTLLLISLLALVTGWQSPAVQAVDDTTAPAAQIYLPMVQRPASSATATPVVTPPPPVQLAFFLEPSWKTSNASVAVDAQGGEHVAFYYYEPKIEQRPTHAVYAYCPNQCDKGASWKSASFTAELVREVQLELTPDGKPRLLIVADSTLYTGGKDYYYATCDGDCSQQAAWTLTKIASGHVPGISLENNDDLPQRAFELDPAGRPRFVYFDQNQQAEPDHFGLFYLTCDSSCDQAAQWHETQITAVTWTPRFGMERVYMPALAFTPDGKPRITSAEFFPIGDGEATLAYFECNDACDNSASWGKVSLALRGGGAEPSADIAVDGAGHPRIAFYQEALLEGQGKRLFYFWCNDNCLTASNWQQQDLGLGAFNGQEPDLELDRQGRPRIAYADLNTGGIGFAWCNEQCDTTTGKWEHKLIEDRTRLFQAWPVAYPPHCDGGLWDSLTPTLILTSNGYPQIAYDGVYHAHCLYDDDPTDTNPPVSRMHLIVRAARLIAFPLPFTLPPDPVTPTPVTPTPVTPTPVTPTPVTPTPVTPTPVTPVVTPTATPVAIQTGFSFFTETRWRTSNTSVAVDGNGGKHLAFYYAEAAVGDNPTFASYFYCPGQCENDVNWNGLNFAAQVDEVQLALNTTGKPSLLIRTNSLLYPGGHDYYYAACTGACTQTDGWTLGYVLSSHGTASVEQHDREQPQRSFTLDPQGRPRFVYLDRNEMVDPKHIGLFYAFCDSNCDVAGQWQEARISEVTHESEPFDWEVTLYPALAFTSAGQPRLITAAYYPMGGQPATLTYYECNDMCELGYTWGKVQLYARGEGPLPSADLAIDAAGHPHVAFYQEKNSSGALPDGSPEPPAQHLLYATCSQSHCMTPMNWDAQILNLASNNGGAPDLALDSQGRPRIAYGHGESGGIGYSWCNADCTHYTAGAWQHGLIESGNQLQNAWPVDKPAQCETGGWQGFTPVLALSPTDEPQVAYDAAYVAHCTTNGATQDELLTQTGRFVVFTQP